MAINKLFFQKGKKHGIFFTLMSAFLLAILIFTVAITTRQEKQDSTKARILSLNSFVKSIEADMDRGLYITSFRAVLAMEQYITQKGAYIGNSKKAFAEALLNGTVEGTNMSIMENSTMADWIKSIQLKSGEADLDVAININSVTISQADAWNLKISMNATLQANDRKKVASWNREETVETSLSVIGLEDPVYLIGTSGKLPNVIALTQYEGNYVAGSDTTNLIAHTNGSFYSNASAPSFLMRLEGNLSASPFGMESLVNVPNLQVQGISPISKSVVDYIYLSNISVTSHRVNNTPSWFYMDDGNAAKYQVAGMLN